MANYHVKHMHLTKAALKKLATGKAVRIEKRHVKAGGKIAVHLTKTQMNSIDRAVGAKKGVNVKMSKAQIRHNIKGGGWGDLFKAGAKALGKAALNSGVIQNLADKGINKLADAAQKKFNLSDDTVANLKGMANGAVNKAFAVADAKLSGEGIKKRVKAHLFHELVKHHVGKGIQRHRKRKVGGSFLIG